LEFKKLSQEFIVDLKKSYFFPVSNQNSNYKYLLQSY
jgi:hypothetical protein